MLSQDKSTSEVTIRRRAPGDAAGLARLDTALTQDGRGMVISGEQVRGEDAWSSAIDDPLQDGWVAESRGDIVGELSLKRLYPSRCQHIVELSMGVHPEHQGQGHGRALIECALTAIRADPTVSRVQLYSRGDNTRAHALYRSVGFVTESIKTGFVRLDSGERIDDLTMVYFPDASRESLTADCPSLADVRQAIQAFVAERRWEQFHDPKNLAMAVASEAGELLSELRWVSSADSDAHCQDTQHRQRIEDELADVMTTLLMMFERTGIDPMKAVMQKLEKTKRKYPVADP